MQHFIILLLWIFVGSPQDTTKLELTPQGFPAIEIKSPEKPVEELIKASKSWASYYNKSGYDVTNVTENSLTISAKNTNAFYYYNVGVRFDHDIKYEIKIVFKENKTYSFTFVVKEIYNQNVLLKTTPTDFFNNEGKLKGDYSDAKTTLEKTANDIVKSYSNFIER